MIVYAPRALRDLEKIEAYIQQFNASLLSFRTRLESEARRADE